ncbi:hypothetical protein DUI87_34261 [Hirundo rustica rustica]|uniref:Hydin adenylate kinase-like domain-containing protein n=2 Tax=Hirundo rustica TaxID=43150 RepID=A0A3M0IS70_HIRRU|nr:hypothetical protein DUI87_34261 [Hirundo rustica rustica]
MMEPLVEEEERVLKEFEFDSGKLVGELGQDFEGLGALLDTIQRMGAEIQGSLAPGEKQVLNFFYMPVLPGAFSRTYQLKVGDLNLESISLKGEAFFPMITVNLPWNIKGNEKYEKPPKQLGKPLQEYTGRNKSVVGKNTESPDVEILKSQTLMTPTLNTQALATQTPKTLTMTTQNLKTQNQKPHLLGSGIVPDNQVQVEMVKMLMEKAALELQQELTSHLPKNRFPDKQLCQSLLKVELPEYVLDMGSVLKGCTERRTLEITNPGQIYLSFQMGVSVLQDTGFSVHVDQVKGLPPRYTMNFDVSFESARWPQGDVDVLLPIKVAEGLTYNIRLHATVLELSLNVSKSTLEFSDILIGQCQLETVRLYNWFQVPCKWSITAIKPVMKKNQHKYMTPDGRQKQLAVEHEPCPFKVTPSEGTLDAGSWQDLQIQFAPKEERSYENELTLKISGSCNPLKLHLSGQGLEPRLEFSPPALEMGWVLVDSDGVEATVVVKNPCSFPIEFYSLDFDEQYPEEEKILRMAVGSEYQKNFVMPPRAVGGTLPPELLEDYEAQKRPKAQRAELKAMAEAEATAEAEAEAEAMGKAAPAHHRAVPLYPEPMVKATGNPISRAVMRHLGIDPSSERREARQQKGIVVVVHGPPRAGKTEIAAALCRYYDGACLSIDTVVKEAIANDGSQAGLCARDLCTKAAMELKRRNQISAGKKPQLTAQTKNKQASEEKINENAKGKNTLAQKKKEPASKPKFTVSTAPAPQQLNITSSCGEELNCLSCVLPEDVLVDILCERLKCKDCYKGVVFDGLESLFASSLESSLLCVLKAVKNRRHIFIVNLHQDYASWKAKEEAEIQREKAQREKEELQREFALQRNIERVSQMDEDEYDALPEEEKAEVDKILLEWNRMRRERELAQKLEEKAKALEEEERQKKEKKGISLEKQPAKPEKGKTKAPEKKETKIPEKGETKIPEDLSEMENLILRFQIYESSQQNVTQVFSYWDRVQGTVKLPVIQKGNNSQSSAENKGQKTNKPQEKVEKKPEQKTEDHGSLQSSQPETQSNVAEGAVRDEHVGVPCLDIPVTDPKAMFREIMNSGRLPTGDQMLRHLGLHPEGPPLPLAAILSIVDYPEERLSSAEHVEPFTTDSPEDAAMEDNLAKAPDVKGSSAEGQPKTGEAASRDNCSKENQISSQRIESPWDSSTARPKSTLKSASTPTEYLRLKRYRWIVPAHGEVELKVHFSAKKPGKFEQTLRFELVETKRQYELPCSGTGLYPSISQDPRLVFPQWRETMEADEIIFKEYIESTKQFHFGPLLCGKSREWYKAQNCPGNSEKITILNNSPMDVEVQFSFENDGEAETFLLDPPSMTLKAEEKQELTIWAYPTSPGFLEDKLICCIGKNPDPVVFSLCCHGVHVKLEISPLELSFDRLLLHRTASRTLVLKNDTLLPMAWQFSGLDDLVEDFSLSQENGIIDPRSEFEVTLNFKARQIGSIEKTLRLEVSDTENILGIVQAENIEVSAEVYDVSLSIDMPEGPDGSLEFGTLHVLDKVKRALHLKKKGVNNTNYSVPSIHLSGCKYESVRRAAWRCGLKEVEEDDEWTVLWTDSTVTLDSFRKMKRFQKINHFPGMMELGRKDLLARNLNRMLRLFPEEYNFFPRTWCLPADYGEFRAYRSMRKTRTFICKPGNSCQGRGIFITHHLEEIKHREHMICQQYISEPFLIDGFKFDMRIYVLVTSCDPLRIFVHKEGLVRFATMKYIARSTRNLGDICMHLTNYAINRHNANFVRDDAVGSKRKLSTLNAWMAEHSYDTSKLWADIDDIVIKTLISAHSVLKHHYQRYFSNHTTGCACFEILGFDILLDRRLKPWLLEVNRSPSLGTDSQVDREVKDALLCDTFNLINVHACDKKRVLEEDKRQVEERLLQPNQTLHESRRRKQIRQAAWLAQAETYENEHLGGFRRIYPAPGTEKYEPFFQQSRSLFQGTAASKAREEHVRHQLEEMRLEKEKLEAATRKKKRIHNKSTAPTTHLTHKGTEAWDRKVKCMRYNSMQPQNIVEHEEKRRGNALLQREKLIQKLGITEQLSRLLPTADTQRSCALPSQLRFPWDVTGDDNTRDFMMLFSFLGLPAQPLGHSIIRSRRAQALRRLIPGPDRTMQPLCVRGQSVPYHVWHEGPQELGRGWLQGQAAGTAVTQPCAHTKGLQLRDQQRPGNSTQAEGCAAGSLSSSDEGSCPPASPASPEQATGDGILIREVVQELPITTAVHGQRRLTPCVSVSKTGIC